MALILTAYSMPSHTPPTILILCVSDLMIQLPVSSLPLLFPKAFLLPSLLRILLHSQLFCHQPLRVNNQPTQILTLYPQHSCPLHGQVACQAYLDFMNMSQRDTNIFSRANTGITEDDGIRRTTISQGRMSRPHPYILRHTSLALK